MEVNNMQLLIKPHDLLFFRDAKPMAAGEGYGNGCNMPLPSSLHSAIRTAILRNEAFLPKQKTISQHTRDLGKNRKIGIDKFGSLKINSFFVWHNDLGTLFPIPKDVLSATKDGYSKTRLGKAGGKIIPLSIIPPSKERVTGLWTHKQLQAYLTG